MRIASLVLLAGAGASTRPISSATPHGPPPAPTASKGEKVRGDELAFPSDADVNARTPVTPLVAEPRALSTPSPLDDLVTNLADSFSGFNAVLHIGAVGASAALSLSGADHEVHAGFRQTLDIPMWTDLANVGGYALPAITGPSIWIIGLATHDRRLTGAGAATLQALGITLATVGTLKFATGRIFPGSSEADGASERARDWDPFRSQLGAWTSGHTAATVSTAAALTAYYPDTPWIPLIGYPLALGVGLGMVNREAHWASDFVAGALIGHAIGFTVGRNLCRRIDGESRPQRSVELVPLAGAAGVSLAGDW